MRQMIGSVALLVRDYDEAIAYFRACLRFDLIEDTPLGGGKRWVLVAPPGVLATAVASSADLASAARAVRKPV